MVEQFMSRGNPINFSAPIETPKLKNKSVLVTGGASGIGLASATYMAEAGASVTIADLQEETGTRVAQELSSTGLKVQFVQCDVVLYSSQIATFKSAVAFGRNKLDIVVLSAGIIGEGNLFDMVASTEVGADAAPPEPGFSALDINLRGVYYGSYLALYFFRLRCQADDTFKKSVVIIGSTTGYFSFPPSSTYSMSKFGVRGLFWSLRPAATKQDPLVRVNLVAPWFTKTPHGGRRRPRRARWVRTPRRRRGCGLEA